jgi:hypothetical protein
VTSILVIITSFLSVCMSWTWTCSNLPCFYYSRYETSDLDFFFVLLRRSLKSMFSYLYSFYLKYTKVYWMYNFHICTSYMKSSKKFHQLVCAYSSDCVTTWPCHCTNVGRRREKKGALNLVNKRTFDSKMFIR